MRIISTLGQVGYKDLPGATDSSGASSLADTPVHDDENADPNTSGDNSLANYFRFVRCRVTVGTQVSFYLACTKIRLLLWCVHNSVLFLYLTRK